MPAEDSKEQHNTQPVEDVDFLASHQTREAPSWKPWLVAAAIVIVGVVALILLGGKSNSSLQSAGGVGMAPADAYALNLPISGQEMSEATSFSGGKVTYIDGRIANTGQRTLSSITVQVGFHSDTGQFAERLAIPLTLIRTRQPYVDLEQVSSSPLQPGQKRDFRLIFDSVPAEWNLQYPEIRVISVRDK
jgi:hypothetical protein